MKIIKKECIECEGMSETQCGHDSHHIDTMSGCDDPTCNNGLVICPECDGMGEIDSNEFETVLCFELGKATVNGHIYNREDFIKAMDNLKDIYLYTKNYENPDDVKNIKYIIAKYKTYYIEKNKVYIIFKKLDTPFANETYVLIDNIYKDDEHLMVSSAGIGECDDNEIIKPGFEILYFFAVIDQFKEMKVFLKNFKDK